MKKSLTILSCILIVSLFATSCSSDKKEDEREESVRSNEQVTGTRTTEPKQVASEKSIKTLSESFSDPELGFTITVNKIARGEEFDVEADDYVVEESEPIFVEITGTNKSSYYTSIYPSDFDIVLEDGSSESQSVYNVENSASGKGFNLLDSSGIDRDDTVTAWLAFEVPKGKTKNLKLRYTRDESNVSGGGTIPELIIEIALP